jgi:hypothetical protein
MLTINITQSHIDKSEPMLDTKTPLGFALQEVFVGAKIHVGIRYVHIAGKTFVLSPAIVDYLEKYDIDGIAEPITLELDLEWVK